MRRYLHLLAGRQFRLLWTGATVSALGDGMSFVAVVWLLLERGGDAALVGWLAAVYTAPVVVGGLAAGILLDRFDKRVVLIADNLVRGLAIASIPIASALGLLTVAQIFVVAAVYGLLYMITVAGIPSLIPVLVPDEDLTAANASETVTYGLGGLAGPAIAGVIIGLLGAVPVLALDALSYGIFVLCLVLMGPLPVGARTAADVAARVGAGVGPAVRFILRSPPVLTITLMFMAFNIGEGMLTVVLPFYARTVAGADPAAYGILASALSGGLIVGSALVGGLGWRWPLGRSIAGAQAAAGLALGGLLLRPPVAGAAGVLGVSGLLASSLTTWAQTIRMRFIPPELRGRVFAVLRTTMQSTTPIGAILGGFVLAGGSLETAEAIIVVSIAVPGLAGLWARGLSSAATGDAAATETALKSMAMTPGAGSEEDAARSSRPAAP